MKYFWTMKNGQQIDVDKMDEIHLRNALKMIIRNSHKKRLNTKTIGNIESNFFEEANNEYIDYETELNFYGL